MKTQPTDNKLRGGYYTPTAIAKFLAAWVVEHEPRSILEPSCGDGNILESIVRRLEGAEKSRPTKLVGVEIDPKEAAKARARISGRPPNIRAKIHATSFFAFAQAATQSGDTFDAIIGNPPFIRYQDFDEAQRIQAFDLMNQFGFHPSRLANSWLPFLAISASLLTEHGRLAMVIPAELFQVGYAAELRSALAERFAHITLVTFNRLVFSEAQQEVVLLLAERCGPAKADIRVCELDDAAQLEALDLSYIRQQPVKPVDHAAEKWTKYFLDADEIVLLRELRELPELQRVGDIVDVDVGVVTGNNDFFVLSAEQRKAWGLTKDTIPIVGRSAAMAGTSFTKADQKKWSDAGRPAHLFYPTEPLSKAAKAYVAAGVKASVEKGYKCRMRKKWYVVPTLWSPDLFFLRQADKAPRFIVNTTKATCTDTLHRGKLLTKHAAVDVATAFNNSLSLAASEVIGRSYGGGVMTFEPSEVEVIPLPIEGIARVDKTEVDTLIRKKELLAAIDVVDQAVLISALGISKADVIRLRRIWTKLSERRRTRHR